jgi:predicted ribosomally synthesized peptide with nif11-like leader
MSIESAKAFYFRMKTDTMFRSQFEQATSHEEKEQIIQAAGYDFSHEEWELATAEMAILHESDEELNQVDLEAIAGGVIYGSPHNSLKW